MMAIISVSKPKLIQPVNTVISHTLDGGVLAKVLGLVPAERAAGLDLRSGSTGKLLVEADNTLHAQSVGGRANCLFRELVSPWFSSFHCILEIIGGRSCLDMPHRASGAREKIKTRFTQSHYSVGYRTLGEATCSAIDQL